MKLLSLFSGAGALDAAVQAGDHGARPVRSGTNEAAMTIRLWVCDEATDDAEGCTETDPCEDGDCGYTEYADLAALLAARWLTCAWCEARSDDEHPTKAPQWHAGWYHCSVACVRKAKANQAKLRAARRDWHTCLARAGFAVHKAEYWGLCGDGVDPQHYPTGRVHTPTFSLTLRLGDECSIAANLNQWHEATGLPIPPPLNLDAPQMGQMAQAQWMEMLRDWMDSSGVGRMEVVAWHDAERALGLRAKWGTPCPEEQPDAVV